VTYILLDFMKIIDFDDLQGHWRQPVRSSILATAGIRVFVHSVRAFSVFVCACSMSKHDLRRELWTQLPLQTERRVWSCQRLLCPERPLSSALGQYWMPDTSVVHSSVLVT